MPPRNRFVPLLVTAAICMPLARPYSAWKLPVRTFTSAIASTFIVSWMVLLPVSVMPMPSIRKFVLPPPPSRPMLVLFSLRPPMPGANCAMWKKLRLWSGRFCTASVVTVYERSPLCA